MIPFNLIVIAVMSLCAGVLLNAGLIKFIINKAIRKFIKPKCRAGGIVFVKYKWLGFFDHGDFKDDKFILLPSLKSGYPVISTYIDVYYTEESIEKKLTVRIDAFFVFIIRVLYSSEIR
jgi:hypothetical protein